MWERVGRGMAVSQLPKAISMKKVLRRKLGGSSASNARQVNSRRFLAECAIMSHLDGQVHSFSRPVHLIGAAVHLVSWMIHLADRQPELMGQRIGRNGGRTKKKAGQARWPVRLVGR